MENTINPETLLKSLNQEISSDCDACFIVLGNTKRFEVTSYIVGPENHVVPMVSQVLVDNPELGTGVAQMMVVKGLLKMKGGVEND